MKNQLLISATKWGLFFKQRNKASNVAPKNILVLSTTGLGDSLWATPSLRAIKKTFPSCHLTVLTSPLGKQVFLNNPYIDSLEIISNPVWPYLQRLHKTIVQASFDTILAFHFSQRLALPLAALSGAKRIIGTQGEAKGLEKIFSKILPKIFEHEIQRRLRIAAEVAVEPDGFHMDFFFSQEELQKSEELFKELFKDSRPVIGIHPGSKDDFKRWESSNFIEVSKNLQKKYNAKIVITGTSDEAELGNILLKNIPGSISLVGQLSLRETALLIKKCSCYIANDTGTMHLGFSVGTPTIGIFSPTNPKLCGPLDIEHGRALYKPPTCLPCIRRSCHSPFCLQQISSTDVEKEASVFLSQFLVRSS